MTLLTTAVALLTVVVALHLLFTFGLVARIRELQQNTPARDSNLPQPGTARSRPRRSRPALDRQGRTG